MGVWCSRYLFALHVETHTGRMFLRETRLPMTTSDDRVDHSLTLDWHHVFIPGRLFSTVPVPQNPKDTGRTLLDSNTSLGSNPQLKSCAFLITCPNTIIFLRMNRRNDYRYTQMYIIPVLFVEHLFETRGKNTVISVGVKEV